MKIVVFGASGKTGQLIVEQALQAGHEVVAYVRRPGSLNSTNQSLQIVVGSLTDFNRIKSAISGAEVCISSLGGNSLSKHATEFMEGIGTILKAMKEEKVKRIIYLSSLGAGDSSELMTQPFRFFIVNVLLRVPLADHTTNEQRISQSSLNFTLVRPGGLTDGPLKVALKHGTEKVIVKNSPTISRASVAAFILSLLNSDTYLNKGVWVYE